MQNITPFDWRRYNALESDFSNAAPARRTERPSRSRARPLTARERTEKILAHRWGNPYCKPGAP